MLTTSGYAIPMLAFIAAATVLAPANTPQQSLDLIREALGKNDSVTIRAQFRKAADSGYLLSMAEYRGGLSKLHIAMFPSPPGWQNYGKYWAAFHAFQDIEEDHDPIYPLLQTSEGWKLGSEIPEEDCGPARVRRTDLSVE